MKTFGRHYFIDGAEIGRNLFAEPKCHIGVGLGVGGGLLLAGGLSAGAGVFSSIESANAQKDAAKAAADSQAATNAQNYKMFQESRGSTGSAILPTYLTAPGGGTFESSLGKDLVSNYNQTNVGLPNFMQATSQLAPAQAGATRTTNDIFNGGITGQMQANNAPVNAARMATARSTSLDALHKTLDEIDAQQAGRGYVGDSYGNKLLSFSAGNQAGQQIGAANLTNTQATADINNYGNVTLPLQNLNAPYAQAQQNAQFAFLPQDQYLQSVAQRTQPFNFLKLQPAAFQYQPLPTPGPGAYSGAANALGALSGFGSGLSGAAAQYYMNQNLQSRYGAGATPVAQTNGALSEFYGQGAAGTTAAAPAIDPTLYTGATGGSVGFGGMFGESPGVPQF